MSNRVARSLLLLALGLAACAEAQPPCDNTCAVPGVEQMCVDGGVATCTEYPDGCQHFGQTRACPEGQVCQATSTEAKCVGTCAAPCQVGRTSCTDGLLSTCVAGADGCSTWGPGVACPTHQRCDAGECIDNTVVCENECGTSGERSCESAGTRICGQFDADACLDLGPPTSCQSDESCVDGQCVKNCSATCTVAGAKACEPGGDRRAFRTCIDVNGCLQWGDVSQCPTAERCDGGACVPDVQPCSDDCTTQGASCQGNAVVQCGLLDADTCLDLSQPQPCDPTLQQCSNGACEVIPPPALVISEVLYDSSGTDDATDNVLFVEIAGPAGASLAGVSIQGTNGNKITLSGAIPTRGYYVVAHPAALPALAALADMTHANVDYQNGNGATAADTDAIQLLFNGAVIDAVGYGLGAVNVAGEGASTPDAKDSNQSISRNATNTDTNNNAADFFLSNQPSPGGPPCNGACTWCVVPSVESVCTDGVDNDCDTLADNADTVDCPL
ncbi:MAG: hypothetical protein AUK47_15265 [Deltaproteobacteria bacterium CG2_30_63_29]|nr:MAG: hypothetical protein AUK47_15265 [Deltaproteobacteria bacterium CG2_30_63_29]PJB40815.1 MAG: hypothetical protein CO108_14160 [Deltaproteobacteria bacterium CG_4_9_14_3_um_filter_63_12]